MKSRSLVRMFVAMLVMCLMLLLVEGNAQTKNNTNAAPAATQGMGGMSGMSGMSAMDMINKRTTTAQRKAAAAQAAKRRVATARSQKKVGVHANAVVGIPGGGGGLTLDQLYFSGVYPNFANSPLPNPSDTVNCAAPNFCGIRKFVDTLPGLNAPNDLGQQIPVAVADTTTFPGSDYYEISVVQYQEKMHADLAPTTLRGYVQTNGGPGTPHYLGPLIVAQSNRPVRIKFTNNLPTIATGGNLFIPVDESVMGAGMGMARGMSSYLQNRATVHLHGGNTPWISDGTPHQWTVPAGDFSNTIYPRGDSVQFVPDMFFLNGVVVPQCSATVTNNCSGGTPAQFPAGATNDPGPGSLTFYYTNQQSARLMFYHDHAYGTTRLNVYAGEAAGYLLTDSVEADLTNGTDTTGVFAAAGVAPAPVLPSQEIPLIIQDKTFVPPNPASAPVYSVGILETGSDYTAPTVSFTGGCATEPTATASFGTIPDPFGQFVYGAITGITLTSGGSGCTSDPVVTISDPTGTEAVAFASLATLSQQDPTWDTALWGAPGAGQLWFPHVYMPNQWPTNPDGSAVNPMGRWDYASWFWPPFTAANYQVRGEIPCGTLPNETCPGFPSAVAPAPAARLNAPGAPNMGAGSIASLTPEAFMDTPIVNGTAYPTLQVDPKTYRFRILNAGNDRTLNLSLFLTCGNGYTPSPTAMPCPVSMTGVAGTEVGMVPAVASSGFPAWWTSDGRAGGVPDPAAMGPSWVVIGTEGGVLPKPVVIPPSPVDYEYNRRSVTVLNVSTHSLMLMPAERSDVIVDFTAYAGKTLILYNDSPAPVPAFDARYDYYTGDPDQTGIGGAPSTLPGFGPNTRTVMQIQVASSVTGAASPALNMATLNATLPAAFKLTQPVPVVPEAAYSRAYGTSFPNTYVHLADYALNFTPIGGTTPVQVPLIDKTIQELFELDYGRMNATLGTELPFTNFNTQTTIPLGYIDPPSEIIKDSVNVISQPVGVLGDGTQIWKITHNGVDSHAIHFHLFNVQVINRFGWDGSTRPPDPTELGWKDTVRMNPLEIDFVALRPYSQTLPWPIPDSIRLADVTMPEGMFDPALSNVNANGGRASTNNSVINFGWEYVWHCHILGHEENDMMRPIVFQVPPPTPANLALRANPWALGGVAVNLYFTDMSASASQVGGGFNYEIATDAGFTSNLVAGQLSYTASFGFGTVLVVPFTPVPGTTTYYYEVQAFTPNGTSPWTVCSGPILPALTTTTILATSPITYGESAQVAVTVTSPQGIPTGNVTLTVDGSTVPAIQALPGMNPDQTIFNIPGLAAGTHSLLATYPDVADPLITTSSASGSIVVNPAALTITAPDVTVLYGDPVPAVTPSFSGFVNGDTSASLTTATVCWTAYTQVSPVSGNPYATSCDGAVDPNYTISYVAGALTVNGAPLTITASDGTMPYAGTVPTITANFAGSLNGDTFAALTAQPSCTTTASSTSPVGSYPSSCTGAAAANYTISYVSGTVTVTAVPLTITASSATIAYGSAVPAITASFAGFVNGESAASLTTAPTCTTAYALGNSVAGSPYGSSCSGGVDPNYSISYVPGTVSVTAVPLTVTASSTTVGYGAPAPAITAAYSGLVNGDTVVNLITAASCSTTYTLGSPVSGSPYTSSCSGIADPNYAISYVPGTVTVTAAPLLITASNGAMTYGGTVPTITAGFAGFVNGQNSSVLSTQPTCSTTTTITSPVGSYASSCTGAAAGNYAISYVAGSVTVNQASSASTIRTQLPNPSNVGQAVVVSASVAPQFTGLATGTVTVNASTGESCAGTLSAGVASCSLTFTTAGQRTLTATYGGDGNFVGSVSAGVTHTVIGISVSVNPTSLAFADTTLNTNSAVMSATLTNTGARLTTLSYSFTDAAYTKVTGTNSCGAVLNTNASCTIYVRFLPTTLGAHPATLNINAGVTLASVALTGNGVVPVAALGTLTPSPLVAVRGSSATGIVTLSNTGTGPLTITGISIGSGAATQFSQTNNCGVSLAAGATCTVTVTFSPPLGTGRGTKTSSLRVRDNSNGIANSLQSTPLTGTAQ